MAAIAGADVAAADQRDARMSDALTAAVARGDQARAHRAIGGTGPGG